MRGLNVRCCVVSHYLQHRNDGPLPRGKDGARDKDFHLWPHGLENTGPKTAMTLLSSVGSVSLAILPSLKRDVRSLPTDSKSVHRRLVQSVSPKVVRVGPPRCTCANVVWFDLAQITTIDTFNICHDA